MSVLYTTVWWGGSWPTGVNEKFSPLVSPICLNRGHTKQVTPIHYRW